MRFPSSLLAGPSCLLPLFLLLLSSTTLTKVTHAYKDSNMYPWGSNPNTHFKMYWKDAANVLQDLDHFQALYVQVHGCVWSECAGADNFDDDGENHDGDEDWYQTRTTQFCANVAYSLYGIRKNNFKLVNTCSKGTYINSFFTYGGADTLVRALGLSPSTKDGNRYSAVDDDAYGGTSNRDCGAGEHNGRFLQDVVIGSKSRQRDRHLSGSGSQDEDDSDWDNEDQVDTSSVVSTSMGCAVSATSKYNKFVMAGFDDDYCSGSHFVETINSLKSYNKALHKVSCTRIWDLGSYNRNQRNSGGNNDDDGGGNDDAYAAANDDAVRKLVAHSQVSTEQDLTMEEDRQLNENNNNDDGNGSYKRTYNSVAEQLLYHSWACDLSLYPNQCPDPYGLKRKYFNVMKAAANGQPITFAVWNAKLRKPIKILTWLFWLTGMYLCCFAYWLRNKSYIANHGGGGRGLWATVQRDLFAIHVAVQQKVQKARDRHFHGSSSRRSKSGDGRDGRDGKRRSSSKKDRGLWATLFGKNKKKKKKKRRSNSQRGGVEGEGGGSHKRSLERERELKRTPSGRSQREEWTDEEDASQYTEMTDEYQSQRSGRSSKNNKGGANYSSSRTSKAAEAAFAAAAQFDLEQQGATGGLIHPPSAAVVAAGHTGNSHHHPSILPTGSSNLEGGERVGERRSSSERRSRSRSQRREHRAAQEGSNNHSQSLLNTSGQSSSLQQSRSRSRSQSQRQQRRPSGMDPSPTRSPGGSSVRRSHGRRDSGRSSKSPEPRVFV